MFAFLKFCNFLGWLTMSRLFQVGNWVGGLIGMLVMSYLYRGYNLVGQHLLENWLKM